MTCIYTQRIVETMLKLQFSWPLVTFYKISVAPVLLFLYRSFILRKITFSFEKMETKLHSVIGLSSYYRSHRFCHWYVTISIIHKQIIVIVFTHYLDHKNVFFNGISIVWPRVFKTAELLICFVYRWYDGFIYVDSGRECLRL